MIDIHSHILPIIDDGSRSVDETFMMLKEAHRNGFNGIICTPHYYEGFYENKKLENQKIVDSLNNVIKRDWSNFNLYLGNEVYLTHNFKEFVENGKASTLNNSNYVLFEFSINDKPLNITDLVDQITDCKLIPILAHPERYRWIQSDPMIVYSLLESGVLFQCNYGSIIGQYGRKSQVLMKKFLENDMVSFLGTDAHRQNTIYSKIQECTDEIQKIINIDKFKQITEINPARILENKMIEKCNPTQMEFTFTEKRIMATQ